MERKYRSCENKGVHNRNKIVPRWRLLISEAATRWRGGRLGNRLPDIEQALPDRVGFGGGGGVRVGVRELGAHYLCQYRAWQMEF